jgi:hypothetical protein
MVAFSVIVIVLGSDNEIANGIGSGLLSGAIVSAVTALLQYFYEWKAIVQRVKKVLPSLYTQLSVIMELTGMFVQGTTSIDDYSRLDFSLLSTLAAHCHQIAAECDISGFSGLVRKGRTEKRLACYRQFTNELWNLSHCIGKAQILALHVVECQLQITMKVQRGEVVSPADNMQLGDYRNSTIVRVSKVHEYEASLMQKLEDLGTDFFSGRNESWETIKAMTNDEVRMILAEAGGSVVR